MEGKLSIAGGDKHGQVAFSVVSIVVDTDNGLVFQTRSSRKVEKQARLCSAKRDDRRSRVGKEKHEDMCEQCFPRSND